MPSYVMPFQKKPSRLALPGTGTGDVDAVRN